MWFLPGTKFVHAMQNVGPWSQHLVPATNHSIGSWRAPLVDAMNKNCTWQEQRVKIFVRAMNAVSGVPFMAGTKTVKAMNSSGSWH